MVEVAASLLFLLGRCPEVAFKSPVTSHSYDTRERIVSHVWHEILRLSPHLFWLGGSHIGRFPPLRMTIRESGWALIWVIRCVFWELAVLYYNTSSSLAKGRAAGWIHEAV